MVTWLPSKAGTYRIIQAWADEVHKASGGTLTIAIDPERCTNCGLCVRACPFDAIFLHPDTECAVTCDLCSGTPVCVKYCPTKCITYSSWEESLEAERGSETTLYKSLI